MTTLWVSPADAGFSGTARDRVYVILQHRRRARQVYDVSRLYSVASDFIRGRVATEPQDYLISDTTNIRREAEIAAHARKTPLRRHVPLQTI